MLAGTFLTLSFECLEEKNLVDKEFLVGFNPIDASAPDQYLLVVPTADATFLRCRFEGIQGKKDKGNALL